MQPASQRLPATLGLHHASPGVRPAPDHVGDSDGGDIGLARVAAAYCGFLESLGQERLTEQVAALLEERLAPGGVIVSVTARHLCMEMRGISRPGVVTTTTAVRGVLADERLQRRFFARLPGAGSAAPLEA